MKNTANTSLEPESSLPASARRSDQEETGSLQASFEAMQRAVRYWGIALLVISFFEMLAPGGYMAYYIVLLFLSILAFFYRSSFMWIVIGVYVVTEGMTQLIMGAGWEFLLGSAIVAGGCLIEYLRRSDIERQYVEVRSENENEAAATMDDIGRRLGILACGFGWLAPIAAYTLMILTLIIIGESVLIAGGFVNTIGNGLMELATLGLAFGIASLLTKTHHRLLAVLGMIPGTALWIWENISWFYFE
jgi:hypothetical protein